MGIDSCKTGRCNGKICNVYRHKLISCVENSVVKSI